MQKMMFNDQYGLTEAVLDGSKRIIMENRAMSKEQFEIVVKVMSLLRSGKISTLTPNCDVREILLAEKIK